MQRPDPSKRREILDVAARLFASRPFHEVRLDDVAAAAHVGKGTIYTYFPSKEAMYLALIREGFTSMVSTLKSHIERPAPDVWAKLEQAADSFLRFAASFPDLFRVMRNGILTADDPELQTQRRELARVVAAAISEGNLAGQTNDPCPELTAQFLLSFIRGAMLYPPAGLTPESLKAHLMRVLRQGIGVGVAA